MQLEKAESNKTTFVISDECFPFKAKTSIAEYVCNCWSDVEAMLLTPAKGTNHIQHCKALKVRVGKTWQPINLESIIYNPSVAQYLASYSRATAEHVKGYLFHGDLADQPNILYGEGQAFDIIRSAKSESELEQIRSLKQESRNNGNIQK